MNRHHTELAPQAIGPYAQAVSTDGWLYTSGQIGLDPVTGQLAEGFEAQARQVLANLRAVLASAGCTPADIVKATIYLANLAHFPTINEVYEAFLGDHRPARSTVQAAALPKGALLEIDLVARIPRGGAEALPAGV
jgi:2-iminobutanoate/2-iminopropanoate deaminase